MLRNKSIHNRSFREDIYIRLLLPVSLGISGNGRHYPCFHIRSVDHWSVLSNADWNSVHSSVEPGKVGRSSSFQWPTWDNCPVAWQTLGEMCVAMDSSDRWLGDIIGACSSGIVWAYSVGSTDVRSIMLNPYCAYSNFPFGFQFELSIFGLSFYQYWIPDTHFDETLIVRTAKTVLLYRKSFIVE